MFPYAQANRERIAVLVVKHVNDEPFGRCSAQTSHP